MKLSRYTTSSPSSCLSRGCMAPRPTICNRVSHRELIACRDSKKQLTQSIDESTENVGGEFCSIDKQAKKVKRSVGEMEQEFIEALSSFYYEKKAILSDEEFETLREELIWNGSKVAVLDSDEQRLLQASKAYARGTPVLTDAEYDDLVVRLKANNSIVTAQGPRCSLRSRKLYSDATTDYLRMTALNLPSVLIVLGFVFALDYASGFAISDILELPPPYGPGFLWGLVLPSIFVLSTGLTNVGFKDGFILKGTCPSCGTENFSYFGDIITVPGNRGTNVVDCVNCQAGLTFDQNKRIIIIDETSEEKQKKLAALAAKKAASAKKKGGAAAATDE